MPATSKYHRHKKLQRIADSFSELSQRVNSPVAHIWYENGNGREVAFGIGDNGEYVLNESLSDGFFSFVWPNNAHRVTLFFSSHDGGGRYQFDRPIDIDFNRHLATRMVTSGAVAWSEVYLNNKHKFGAQQNYLLEPTITPGRLNDGVDSPSIDNDMPVMYLRGDMNSWNAEYTLIPDSANSLSTRVSLADTNYVFKFADEDWSPRWNFGAGFNVIHGLNRSAGADNLSVNLPKGQLGEYEFRLHLLPVKGGLYAFYQLQLIVENASAVDIECTPGAKPLYVQSAGVPDC